MKSYYITVFPPRPSGGKTFFLLWLIILLNSAPMALASASDSLLTQARLLYYESLKDKTKLETAMALFTSIGQSDTSLHGRTQTYLGSLTAVKAKFAFWPHQKLKWAKRGLHLMDTGLAQSPEDIEALFIHGTTCYYLPNFFGRGDDAQRHLRKIVRLLPEQAYQYDPELIANVIQFLLEKIDLTEEERAPLQRLNMRLAKK